ncbi:hypothetical protein [Bartonella ancashensis]|uniref:Uncharacterized protein n=1 Tax=Bartonella ancashensis TaxID=1318743 RepID=A0A0M4LIL7_9HYPH|nr:hypothetical protein [Bartonella ancashensis]ALE03543.1 hypothetical protein PU02_0729 [Bartonella ancashensis]
MRSFSDSEVKSYLDDISRAILAEHRAREKAQEQTLEYLNAIKILIQSFRHEKNF